MAKKFIINNGDLILGHVEFHEDLLKNTNRERSETVGGGFWHRDPKTKKIYFWGVSQDFGRVTREQFDESFKQPSVESSKIYFSLLEFFSDAMEVFKKYV